VHAYDADVVVLDEAQRIKNWATKSATYVKMLTPRYRLVLTGTPMENRLEELASVLDWLDDVALAPKWRLEPWHTYAEGDAGRGRSGARNLDTLRERLRPVLVRRVRKDVLSQLPPRTDTRVSVPMTDAQRGEHDDLIRPIAQLLARARRRPLTQAEFLKLMTLLAQQRMISNGLGLVHFEELWPVYEKARPDPALLDGLSAPKLHELRRIVEAVAVAQGRKIVIFSQWRRMLRLAAWSVRDVLGAAGLRAVFFTGAESQRLRTQTIVDFHDEPGVAVMFLSDAGGVGLNLQRAASCCINLELPWNPAVLEQRIGRIYRIGQELPIDVYNLVCDYGIEARIAELVASKRALFSGLFDGTTDEVCFESGRHSFLVDVEKLVPEAPDLAATGATSSADETAPDAVVEEASEDAPPPADALPAIAERSSPRPPWVMEASAIGGLFSAVRTERTADGGLRIDAPPEAAASLVALFEGMARLLGASSVPRGEGPS
jgi:SNF2 family DNA or RNA helicase